jgi:hypothetical protein
MPEELTPEVWKGRLKARGHLVPAEDGLAVWPSPDTVVTVALEADPTLRTEYRGRYFLCEPEPEHILNVVGCPEPHRGRWTELLLRQPYDFLAGPGSWLLARLARFRRVVTWTAKEGCPRLLDGPLAEELASCLLAVVGSWEDSYLADEDARELYLAHHHEKIVVSVPYADVRREMLREFAGEGWVFEDVSGYGE